MGVKISELAEANSVQNTDILPIVQNAETKKVKIETINNFLKQYTTGTGTINTTYVDTVENNHYEKSGNIVSYAFTITAKGTWAANTSFISGLPRPVANVRFIGVNAARDVPFRAAIFTDGTIRNAYSQTTPTAGDRLEGQITYITTD